jgi:hypothetical protein
MEWEQRDARSLRGLQMNSFKILCTIRKLTHTPTFVGFKRFCRENDANGEIFFTITQTDTDRSNQTKFIWENPRLTDVSGQV